MLSIFLPGHVSDNPTCRVSHYDCQLSQWKLFFCLGQLAKLSEPDATANLADMHMAQLSCTQEGNRRNFPSQRVIQDEWFLFHSPFFNLACINPRSSLLEMYMGVHMSYICRYITFNFFCSRHMHDYDCFIIYASLKLSSLQVHDYLFFHPEERAIFQYEKIWHAIHVCLWLPARLEEILEWC